MAGESPNSAPSGSPAPAHSPAATSEDVLRLYGSCACGFARYEIDSTAVEGALTLSAFCHCSKCQRNNGCPFVHTTHWKRAAVRWLSGLDTTVRKYEVMPNRKWKLRCAGDCGSPLGSWNAAKDEWTIWPATLNRDDVGRVIGIEFLRPDAHQFYGEWRAMEIDDDLPKFIGYPGKSTRVG